MRLSRAEHPDFAEAGTPPCRRATLPGVSSLKPRRLYVIVGGIMIGAGTGSAADALVTPSDSAVGAVLPMLLAGLGLGIMVASALRE